ncbi:hypothetical protein G647_10359 [Cladophialophora carrionii CBS 160.54]|uniref:F-box domain-containing protein n=1 Tax=Cladophialophora carrionii CBS 160.54 TaxID=1279043 RepID=V9DIG7_9EURO|nr:uncharacterized protein G647_10359 [Cladophialophora carrionii CBS 160.54]ETI26699.1 hypothetical protein G647_10359 [Cladophialophora carrionii CBS 160.54]
MDLPSVQIALNHIDPTDSDISDPPEDADNTDVDMLEEDSTHAEARIPAKPKAISVSDEELMHGFSSPEDDQSLSARPRSPTPCSSKFEEIPTEAREISILNKIVSHLPNDKDLLNLSCSCKTFAALLVPKESAIWKERFLLRYDYPYISDPRHYIFAYQLRRAVLRQFVEFTDPKDPRLGVQMDVLRDMVIEAYKSRQAHVPPPSTSKNLAAFASPHNSPWIRTFLSCFFFPCRGQRYGQPNPLFDAIQLVLSHLLLSPTSQLAHVIKSSRGNYDLAVVYAWDRSLETLFRESAAGEEHSEPTLLTYQERRNLRKHSLPDSFLLDTHALLHIRNFWHRHLIEERQGFGSAGMVENTYRHMAKDLTRAGINLKKWDKHLNDDDLQIAVEWYGHYSTLAQWPKKKQELEEVQSLAEDWQRVDPLKLDFTVSDDNDEDGFWPPIFANIPIFQNTIPGLDSDSASCSFIRGLAPFVVLSSPNDMRTPPDSQSGTRLPKYHPYLAMRLRGVVHSIPAQPRLNSIPGWRRIIMVLYKPTCRHLIQVLEHAEQEYGDSFTTTITTQMAQSGTSHPQVAHILNGVGAAGQQLDPAEIDAHLTTHLCNKLLNNQLWRDGSKFDKDVVEEMEEKYRLSEYLDWNDIDYAYAYEGSILPSGKIMMGRWWRLAMNGEGDGSEWSDALDEVDEGDAMDLDEEAGVADGGQNGNGATHGNGIGSGSGSGSGSGTGRSRFKKLERGPFIFWC